MLKQERTDLFYCCLSIMLQTTVKKFGSFLFKHITAEFIGFAIAVLVIAAPAYADSLGQTQNFSIDPSYDGQHQSSLTATMVGTSDHAYYYVDNRLWNT